MKNRTIIHVCLLALFMLVAELTNAQTVYTTESGKKYHKKNCTVVKEGKKGIELADAKKKGYTPCSVCKPDVIATEPKKKK